MPDPKTYEYSFDKTSEVVEAFLEKVGFTHFGLYVQDYGGPVGFRILERHPEWLDWLIIQNTNAYEEGFSAVWDSLRNAYWKRKTPETEKPLEAFLEADTVRTVYTHGHPNPELISPDNWICTSSRGRAPSGYNSTSSTTIERTSSSIRSGRRFCVGVSQIPSFFGARRTSSSLPQAARHTSETCPRRKSTA
jgi:pimeloyl-ACP methyl ester carboxylesterase